MNSYYVPSTMLVLLHILLHSLFMAEDIMKRWQEYIEELYKNDLHDPDNHHDMITHLEPDILEFKVKWALGSITTNKGTIDEGMQLSYFKS